MASAAIEADIHLSRPVRREVRTDGRLAFGSGLAGTGFVDGWSVMRVDARDVQEITKW